MLPRLLLIVSLFAVAYSEFVDDEFDIEIFKKSCRGVDSSQCVVHAVRMNKCIDGPRFCTLKTDERYSINIDFTPNFTAFQMKAAVSNDHDNVGSFYPVKVYKDACGRDALMPCPLLENYRYSYNVPFTMNKRTPGKFPIQVMLWNGENEKEACCFTFRAKVY